MTQPNCEPLQYPSADKNHIIAGYLYTLPGAAPRAVIQISHGMCEYIGRYRHLIDFFTAQGFAVAEERTLQETSGEHLLLVMEKSI